MRFIKTGNERGDCTTPYKVTEYEAKTVVEFIQEVLQENTDQWGYFKLAEGKNWFFNSQKVEYKRGELKDEIPDEWQYRFIEKVNADGGWGMMMYFIYPKQ